MSTATIVTRSPVQALEDALTRRLANGDEKAATFAEDLLEEVRNTQSEGASRQQVAIAAADEAKRVWLRLVDFRDMGNPKALKAVRDVFGQAVVDGWLSSVSKQSIRPEKETEFITFLSQEGRKDPDGFKLIVTRLREGLDKVSEEEAIRKVYSFLAAMSQREHPDLVKMMGRSMGQYAPESELVLAATILREVHGRYRPESYRTVASLLAKKAIGALNVADTGWQMRNQCNFVPMPNLEMKENATVALLWTEVKEKQTPEDEGRVLAFLNDAEQQVKKWRERNLYSTKFEVELIYLIKSDPGRAAGRFEFSRTRTIAKE